ncbi:hypothetical protein B4U79_08647, partial [Dinothrombium tinctorium]
PADLETDISVSQQYEEKIIAAKVKLAKRIQSLSTESKPRVECTNFGDKTMSSVRNICVKLPCLEIDKFYGEISHWQQFWSQFESAVHLNDQLKKSDNLVYLKSFLGGNAARALFGLEICDENYESAVELLKNRFGREDVVINAHMNKLLAIDPVKRSSEVKLLRRLYDECEVQIRSLETLGVTADTYGNLLCPILLKLIPDDIALEYSRQQDKDDAWNAAGDIKYNKAGKENENRNSRRDFPSALALNTMEYNGPCIFCRSDHKFTECDSSPQEKLKILKKEKRCFVCLRKGHMSSKCTVRKKCQCGHKHHPLICVNEKEKRKEVVEATAKAIIDCDRRVIVRCLFDGGSQRSFVTEEVSRKLNLPIVGSECISISTFDYKKSSTKRRNKVKILLRNVSNPNRSLEINALETESISIVQIIAPDQMLSQEMERRGLSLADFKMDKFMDEGLSVLIGADYYWNAISGKTLRLSDSLVAIESIFGWCLHGATMKDKHKQTTIALHSACDDLISKEL